jgi:UTP-glucose-1-phosphate uridylyltransferase
MMESTLVIMAAGMGSRYGGLKQIDPVGPYGELIIDYSIFDALRAGFDKIVFVIKKSIESDFLEIIGNRIANQCETAYVFQEMDALPKGYLIPDSRSKPWGTGHATLICKNVVNGPFAVINADDFYGTTSFDEIARYLSAIQETETNVNYCMVGYLLVNTLTENGHVARGVCEVDSKGNLVGICERTRIRKFGETAKYSEDEGETWEELPLNSTVSMNLWGFTPSIFSELEKSFHQFLGQTKNPQKDEFFLPEVVNQLLKTKQAMVKVIPTNERWVGVTYREDKSIVEQYIRGLVRAGIYPENLWE